jgi:FkbM family methyltransferase
MKLSKMRCKLLFNIYKAIPLRVRFRYINILKRLFPADYEKQFMGYIKVEDRGLKDKFWMCSRVDSYMEGEFKVHGLYGGWEKESLKIWAKLCDEAQVILDIGANTGVFSLLAAHRKPDATIIAVEPIDVNFSVLQRNIKINNADIKTEKVALSDTNGTATMYMLKDRLNYMTSVNDNRYQLHPEISGEHEVIPITVPLKTYEYLEQKYSIQKINLIKIDVEGHEFRVLNAMADQIKKDRPVILIEVIGDDNAVALDEMFKKLNYRFISMDETNISVVVDKLWDNDHHNFLLCHDDTIKYLQNLSLVEK